MDVSWGRFGLVFSSIGAVLVGAVLVCVGRFGDGPFWSVPHSFAYGETSTIGHHSGPNHGKPQKAIKNY